MNDIEKAIEHQTVVVEYLKQNRAEYEDVFGTGDMTADERKKHYAIMDEQIAEQDYILQILREKAEREKGCEYCKNGTRRIPVSQLNGTLIRHKKYCDVCGRKLVE